MLVRILRETGKENRNIIVKYRTVLITTVLVGAIALMFIKTGEMLGKEVTVISTLLMLLSSLLISAGVVVTCVITILTARYAKSIIVELNNIRRYNRYYKYVAITVGIANDLNEEESLRA